MKQVSVVTSSFFFMSFWKRGMWEVRNRRMNGDARAVVAANLMGVVVDVAATAGSRARSGSLAVQSPIATNALPVVIHGRSTAARIGPENAITDC